MISTSEIGIQCALTLYWLETGSCIGTDSNFTFGERQRLYFLGKEVSTVKKRRCDLLTPGVKARKNHKLRNVTILSWRTRAGIPETSSFVPSPLSITGEAAREIGMSILQ